MVVPSSAICLSGVASAYSSRLICYSSMAKTCARCHLSSERQCGRNCCDGNDQESFISITCPVMAGCCSSKSSRFSSKACAGNSPLKRLRFWPPVEDDRNWRTDRIFKQRVHEKALAVRRDHVELGSNWLKGASDMRGKQRDGCPGFQGLPIRSGLNRHGHQAPIEPD